MAKITVPKQIAPITIQKFLGQNDTPDGELGLKLGESTNMRNVRITPNYKLKQREGYRQVIGGLTGNVQGMWYGKLNGTMFFLFANAGHLYSLNTATGIKTDLGTLTDAPTRFTPFGSKVYIHNGYEFKSFDGTSLQVVTGYRPKIAVSTPPAGGGTPYEQVNLLTGTKHQTFRSNGTSKDYFIAEQNVDSIDFVILNGVTKTLTTDYTIDKTTGKVSFVSQPPNNVGTNDDVDIGWTKGTGQRALIENCRFSMEYSGQTDVRVFLWGNQNYKNRLFWSGLANGVPSAEYWEALSLNDIGSGQYAITDVVKQYDRQKIFFEDSAMYSYYSTQTIAGQTVADFPTFELNENIGNVAFGQVQIVNNMPMTLFSGVHAWQPTYVRDQTDESLISQRVQDSLTACDLSQAVTVNWRFNKEYWINIGSIVWIYNYLNDTWYLFDNIHATCFLEVNNQLYFGANGAIYVFDTNKRNDNGIAINAIWEMGFWDAGADYLLKFMNYIHVGLNPMSKSRLNIQYVTNNDGMSSVQTITYNLIDFSHIDFDHFSFETSYNPQPFKLDIQASQFAFFKLLLTNTSLTDTFTVLSINLPVRFGGKVQ